MAQRIRIGLIGAGGNTRLRHIPGFLALPDVELAAVCNRRPESTEAIAREFKIPRTSARWEELVADPNVDAICIGTWPYLHGPITLAALEAGKHVLTEARISINLAEAKQMLDAARQHPSLVTQVVPSPFGLKGDRLIRRLLASGFLGALREVQVCHFTPALADPHAPLSWRQDASLSGVNMLTLGIVHETLLRWVPPPVEVRAQTHAHIATRVDASGSRQPVGTPDSVQVLATLENGARASYHFSGVTLFGQEGSIRLLGSDGVLHYDLLADRILGASKQQKQGPMRASELPEIAIPPEEARGWTVEADFIAAIREKKPIELTTFEAGVAYMAFTEAVAESAAKGHAVTI